ncbi:MAG: SdrD B-like domain-containing protein, partial [Bacteroidota bacterium]
GGGSYSFTNLASNMQYFVEFVLPGGFSFSPKDAAADNIDSDANPGNGRTDCTFLSPGENDNSIDAGIFSATPQNGTIGDFVWKDLDKDGIQDAGEPGCQGVLVKLYRCDNTFIGQFTTNANGGYQLINLTAGS